MTNPDEVIDEVVKEYENQEVEEEDFNNAELNDD